MKVGEYSYFADGAVSETRRESKKIKNCTVVICGQSFIGKKQLSSKTTTIASERKSFQLFHLNKKIFEFKESKSLYLHNLQLLRIVKRSIGFNPRGCISHFTLIKNMQSA